MPPRFTYVICRPTGEPIGEATDAQDRGLTVRLNGTSEATVVLSLNDAISGQLAPDLARLKVYRRDATNTRRLVFYGDLPAENVRDDAAAGTVTATFADSRRLFGEMWTLGTETYTATDQGSILWGLITTQHGRFGGAARTFLRQGDITTGIIRTRTFDRQPLAAVFDSITKVLDGPDIHVEPVDYWETEVSRDMGKLHVYAKRGQLRPNAKFLYLERGGGNCGNMGRHYMKPVTYSTVLGQSAGASNIPIRSAWGNPTTSLYGLRENYRTESDIAEQAVLDAQARGEVEAFIVPRSVVSVMDPTPEAPQPWDDYEPGDTVYVTCRKGSMIFTEVPMRVHQIDVKLSQEGRESVTLTLAEPTA